jgi:hypothetical protein
MQRTTLIFMVGIIIACSSNVLHADNNPSSLAGTDPVIINAIDNWLTSFFRHNIPKGNIEIRYRDDGSVKYIDHPGYRIYKLKFGNLLKAYNDINLVDIKEQPPLNLPFLEYKYSKMYYVEPTKKCTDIAEEIKENGDCVVLMAKPGVDSVKNVKNMVFRSTDPSDYKVITGTYKVNKFPIGEEFNSVSSEKVVDRYKIRALVAIDKISKECTVVAVDWGYIGEDLWESNGIATFITNLTK